MVSKNNQQWKQQQEARRVPHYGIRKLSIGVASVLLGTVFYMQNGAVHADVNPMVSAGNNSAKVINENSGTGSLTRAASTSTGVGSASSVFSAGDATNSMVVSQASGSPAGGATKQVNDAASEPGSTVPAGQVNTDTDKTNAPVPNRQTSVAGGNPSKEHLSDNLSLSVNQNSNFNFSSLLASKVALTGSSNNTVNGGFDKATWGTLDVNAWKGYVQGDYYRLTNYTGDANHVIVPNAADFAKAGISTSGKQVGVPNYLMSVIFNKATAQNVTVAFSKTDNKMVKAINDDWSDTWASWNRGAKLSRFDGTHLDVSNVKNMRWMFEQNQISDLSPLASWNVDNVTDMNGMFSNNNITDLSPLANWKVDNVKDMRWMFVQNQISDLSPLASWNVDNVTKMNGMFDSNYSTQTKNLQAKRVINFIYPTSYTGKKQGPVTQTVDLSQKVSVRLITKNSKPSNNILDWVTEKEIPQASDLVYFQDYAVPEIKGLLPDKTVIARQPADVTKPINVTVTYKLVDSNTNDAFALDSENGLYEHANVNDNGGYDTDFWGTLDVSKFTTVKNGDDLEITGYTGDASKVIIPNIVDFEINNLDQGAKQVTISSDVMRQLAKNATRIGLSKTDNQKVVASDAIWSDAFGGMTNDPTSLNGDNGICVYNPSLTAMDLHNLDTTNITDMSTMFKGGSNLNVVGDLSQWNTANVVNMNGMFAQALLLTNIGDLDNWNTAKVTNMGDMFSQAVKLTNIGNLSKWDVANVTNMGGVFQWAWSLTNIGDLDNWNTAKVTNMSWMFSQAVKLTNIGDLSKWDVANVTNMGAMFQSAASLTNIGDLDNWNTAKVTNMGFMFSNTFKLTNIGNLSKWDVANVINMQAMFQGASSLADIGDLSKWNTSKVVDMSNMFFRMTALKQLNISNWNLAKLMDKDAFQRFVMRDLNLVVIANNIKLPTWYQNELSNSNDFWNDHLAVITNNESLLKASGSVDNVTIDDTAAKRPVFYNSNGSADALAVLKQVNQAYIKQYQNEHPGYTLNLAADVDQTDPIALANARFVSAPREVQFTIAYYDLTGKLVDSTTSTHKVGETVSIAPVAPDNYVLVSGQSSNDRLMHWGLNEADFLVEPKVTTTTQTKTVSRTIKVQTPDGQTNNVVQTVKFVRNGYLNQVTKQTTYSTWSFNGHYQFSSYQPKPVDGYTADVVPTVIVTPDSSDTMVSLAYHKQVADYSVDYQLANGTVVKNVSVTPERDGTIHLTAPQGYRLLTTVTDVKVGSSSQQLAVLVAPAEQTYTVHDDLPSGVTEPLTKTVTRTVKITMPNGHIRTVKQSVKFERTATVKSDGTVVYGNWQALGRAQFSKVFVPKRHGYHLAIMDDSGKALSGVEKINTVTAAMDNAVVNVQYVKD